ncbi:hypothetical protein HEK616_62820 [Streptomyces nigrescens]|uniref:TPM domain-containing protein n=1 Tax=Streptomyces nigrescens TaxID=1920 RepID=A0ABN6R5H4_STRNI|nr:hypothetical protein [Streptomyces nigrescens]BDM72795.1 hypothetical protein HEK616_62820 [Streptomyces nigrescens]
MVGAVLRTGVVLVMGWLAVLFCAGAVQAAPGGADAPTQTAYLAGQLRKNPVFISDQIPRAVPRSTAPDFAKEARRLGVPTYVMILPNTHYGSEATGLLAGVHDRLARKGLYVTLSPTGLDAVQTYGVSLPGAEDASRATLYELPYDATPREVFRHFVDVLTSGHAHQRAEAAHAKYGDSVDELPLLHTDRTAREDQSFATGVAVTGIPLTAVLLTLYAVRRRRVRRAAAAGGGLSAGKVPVAPKTTAGTKRSPAGSKTKGTKGSKRGSEKGGTGGSTAGQGARTRSIGASSGQRVRMLPLVVAAVVLGGLVAFTASQVFDDTTSGDGSRPTAADMRARVDRVAEGLRRDPLYVDPESPPALDAAERTHLRTQLRALRIPTVIAAVSSNPDDESDGEKDLLVKALHDRLHRKVLIVLAEPSDGGIELANYGTPVDPTYLMNRPRYLEYSGSADPALGRRLDQLLTYLGKAPTAKPGAAESDPLGYDPPPAVDPVEEQALPGLFTGDFHPGLVLGVFAALLVTGLVAAGCGTIRVIVMARRRRYGAGGGSGAAHGPHAPERPSLAWLRRAARHDLDALTAALEPATAPEPGAPEPMAAALPAEAQRRAWECLDAAALLIDGDSDGRIDVDATPAVLACAIVLARAGRTAIDEPAAARHVCHRNPLHGPARKRSEKRPGGGTPGGATHRTTAAAGTRGTGGPAGRRRAASAMWTLPVCEGCRVTHGAVLKLRSQEGKGRGAYVPYATLPGPLAALADGAEIDQLTRDVREYFGVH